MAEENIEVSAGCNHERLQFGHALPHLLFFFWFPKFWVGRVRETRNQIGLALLLNTNMEIIFACVGVFWSDPTSESVVCGLYNYCQSLQVYAFARIFTG